jgi:hypothetical protein
VSTKPAKEALTITHPGADHFSTTKGSNDELVWKSVAPQARTFLDEESRLDILTSYSSLSLIQWRCYAGLLAAPYEAEIQNMAVLELPWLPNELVISVSITGSNYLHRSCFLLLKRATM